VVEDGVAQPPVKVGSGVTNAKGVYLISGQWTPGDHTVVIESAPNFNNRAPVTVSP